MHADFKIHHLKERHTYIKKLYSFLVVSVYFWFLTKLSKDYNSTIQYPMVFENLPKDKLLQKKPQESIDIHVKASGFKILSGKLFPKHSP